ncbi:MAG TPA: ABC transporter permease [Acidimicrobiales bacterium]|nr:ABC transporter permease [Acidimicrobiales bacterium]
MGFGMLPVVVIVAALVVYERRRRRRTQDQAEAEASGDVAPSASGARPKRAPVSLEHVQSQVLLVAARELHERLRGRIFKIGTVLILAVVAGAIIIPTLHSSGKPQPVQFGVVGNFGATLRVGVAASAKAAGVGVHVVTERDARNARADLRSGRLDVALVDGRELELNKSVDSTDTSTTVAQFVAVVARDLGVAEAFEAAGLTPQQATAVVHAKPLPVISLQASKAKGSVQSTSVIGLILTFVMLTQYNTWILIGVMEEKSSRVVEVLLAALRPVQLLAGKVLGIGLVAFAQAALIVSFALVLAAAVGSNLLHGTAPLVLVSSLFWLVLGYAFYCWVYAAAGSMAERQDQVQSLAFPLSVPIIFAYIVSITAVSSQSASIFIKVLAYIPLTAPFAMPTLVSLKAVAWWQFAASAVITIAATFGVARLAAGIYRRAILRTGRRVRLRDVLVRS